MVSEDIIKQIVQEVMKRTQGQEAVAAKPETGKGITASPPENVRSVLCLVTGAPAFADEAIVQLRTLSQKGIDMTFIFTRGAKRVLNIERFRLGIPGAKFLTVDEVIDPERFVEAFDIVAIPLLSMNSAAKLAMMISDNVITIVALWALGKGKRVVASYSSILFNDAPPAGVIQKRDEYVKTLREIGIEMVETNQFAEAVTATAPLAVKPIADKTREVQPLLDIGADRVSSRGFMLNVGREVAAIIDHTLLKQNATSSQITKLCEEAKQYSFASVCVNPGYVALAKQLLRDSRVKVCTVVGFPLGATTPFAKAQETIDAVRNGADEIDMVINVGAMKSGDFETIRKEIREVVTAAGGRITKVILETALLTDEEKVRGCQLAKESGADFVKTSTGFSTGGATPEDIALMRRTVGIGMGVKASGGVKDLETAIKLIRAGASRLGASASVAIAKGESSKSDY